MTAHDHAEITTMSTKAMALVDAYQASTKEIDRQNAIESVADLLRALEKPADLIVKLFFSPAVLMVVKTAHDLNIFIFLSQTTSYIDCAQLAAVTIGDIQLIERIMRALACNGFASEQGPGRYEPTSLSKQMTERRTIGTMNSLFVDFLPIIYKTPEFFQKTGYKNPGDPKGGPLQHAYNTTESCWDWLAENPEASDRFNTFMEGYHVEFAHWTDWFPVEERLLEGALADQPLLVDVGGGRGHDLVVFKERFPVVPQQLVLEDLPSVIKDTEYLDDGIRRVGHDFFKPQPIEGARAYYIKHIMHDWSDDNCKIILKHITAVMERGYSKILIEDHIVPDQNAKPQETLLDMIVMVWCPGIERTRQRWKELLESVGLVINNFWLPDGHNQGIIEAELPKMEN